MNVMPNEFSLKKLQHGGGVTIAPSKCPMHFIKRRLCDFYDFIFQNRN